MARLEEGSLILERGETLRFPVEEDSPLAPCQRMRRIESLDDIRDFQFVQEWSHGVAFPEVFRDRVRDARPVREEPFRPLQAYLSGNRISAAELLRYVREHSGDKIMRIEVKDFIVPAGSTVVLASPQSALSEIDARTVVIAGTLKFTDDLVIRCNELRGA